MKSKILSVFWFTQAYHPHHFGMVKVQDSLGVIGYCIGTAKGVSEKIDTKNIAQWGSKISRADVLEFFNEDKSKEIKDSPDP